MGTMEPSHQQLLRQVIKRVHPDLFLAHPFEMKVNSDSLQVRRAVDGCELPPGLPTLRMAHQGSAFPSPASLASPLNTTPPQALNAYADQLAVGASPTPAQLEFYVRTGDAQAGLALITATLPGDGDLLPLFSAFGLADEAAARGTGELFAPAASLAAWLRESLSDAARLAGEHAALAAASQELRTAVERAYDLGHLQVGWGGVGVGGGQEGGSRGLCPVGDICRSLCPNHQLLNLSSWGMKRIMHRSSPEPSSP